MPNTPKHPHHPFISARERAFYHTIAKQILRPWETLIEQHALSEESRMQILDLIAAGIKASRDTRR